MSAFQQPEEVSQQPQQPQQQVEGGQVFAAGDQLLYYNTQHRCRYHADSVISPEERKVLSEAEIAYVQDYLYQEDLMCIFHADFFADGEAGQELNYDELVLKTEKLYVLLKDYAPFQPCMQLAAANLLSADMDVGLLMLYAFDYMHWTHRCVSQFLTSGWMEPEVLAELHRALLANR